MKRKMETLNPKTAIPHNWFQGKSIGILISGGYEGGINGLALLERLSEFSGIELHCWVTQKTLQFITTPSFSQFAHVHPFDTTDPDSSFTEELPPGINCFVLLDFGEQQQVEALSGILMGQVEVPIHYQYAEPDYSLQIVLERLAHSCTGELLWTGKKVLVTAGRTEEDIDPVRIITNRSSGKMGFALARQAMLRGADVTLVTGPTNLETPYGITRIDVRTADEMLEACLPVFNGVDVVFAAAAVEDLKPVQIATHKMKKQKSISIECETAVDVLASLGEKKHNQFLVGFSVETENIIEHSRDKLRRKSLNAIVANNPRESGAAFQHDTNKATLITRQDQVKEFPLMDKNELAAGILEYTLTKIKSDA